MAYIPIKGFAPDADPTDPGILLECDLLIPTLNGMAALPADTDAGLAALASTAASAVSIITMDGVNHVFAATAGSGSGTDTSVIYKSSAATWSEVSSTAAGNNYTATAAARWTFAQYGDDVFAVQKGHGLQRSTGATGEFTAVTATQLGGSVGLISALVVENVLDFVVMFNINDSAGATTGDYGDSPDRWICSGAGNPATWQPSIGTQCTTGRLTDSPGAIIAAKRLGSNLVAYKRRSMYLGQYIGAPLVWSWRLVPGEGLGTFSPYSVVDVEGVGHFFPGSDEFYIYDGSRATPISTNRVSRFFHDQLNISESDLMFGLHHRQAQRVYWWFPTGSSTVCDSFLCYNYRSDRWGFGRKEVRFAFEYLAPGISYDDINTFYSGITYDNFGSTLGGASYDSAFATSSTYRPAIFSTENKVELLTGSGSDSSLKTWNIGVDGRISLIDRVRPRFKTAPDTGVEIHYFSDTAGSVSAIARANINMTDGSFDDVFAARWHSFRQSYTGSMEITGFDIEIREDSLE